MGTKLIIQGLTDKEGKGDAGPKFELQLNPEAIKHSRTIKMDDKTVGDTAGPVGQFQGYGDDTLNLDFILDGTGVMHDGDYGTVEARLKELESCIYNFDAGLHKPRFLLVSYSGFVFRCAMTSFNTDYMLFNANGMPLRAKVSLALKGSKEEKKTKKQSPDMSHAKLIREGDSLPLLCNEVYGKMDYYLQVAEHNGLTNFRELEVGSVIEFPPLQR